MTNIPNPQPEILGIKRTVTVSGSTTLVGTISTTVVSIPAITGSVSVISIPSITGSVTIIGSVTVTGSTTSAFPTLTKGSQSSTGLSVQELKDAGRTNIRLYSVAQAPGTSTVETLMTLTKSSQDSAVTTGTSFSITNGKIFRVTALAFASKGNTIATSQFTIFNLRLNTAGTITTASTVLLSIRSATPAVADSWDRVAIPLADGIEITGDGTKEFGVTSNVTYSVNAPSLDVQVIGFEY